MLRLKGVVMNQSIQYKILRSLQNLTQDDLANILGVTRPYVSMIENGKRRPSPELRLKISKVLESPAEVFISGQRILIDLPK